VLPCSFYGQQLGVVDIRAAGGSAAPAFASRFVTVDAALDPDAAMAAQVRAFRGKFSSLPPDLRPVTEARAALGAASGLTGMAVGCEGWP
jgi:hypothetical protein